MLKPIKIIRFAAYSLLIGTAGFLGSLYAKNSDFTNSLPSVSFDPPMASADIPYQGDDDCDDGDGDCS